jgi:hypothetical protein
MATPVVPIMPGRLFYRPLDTNSNDIRLLRLLPANDPQCIPQGEIFIASLDSQIEYEALSYTWGNPERRGHINIDGAMIEVGENLANALRDIRRTRS